VRILLDECLDQRFRQELPGHEVVTVQDAGWAGTKNGELLALASSNFDVFITVDRNLSFQQNLSKFKITIFVLSVKTNHLVDLKLLTPEILSKLTGHSTRSDFTHFATMSHSFLPLQSLPAHHRQSSPF
jgi:predicted nuclease of predicted toxin-antitoxin system